MNKKNFSDIIHQKLTLSEKIILKDGWNDWTWKNLIFRSFAYAEFIKNNYSHVDIPAIPIMLYD